TMSAASFTPAASRSLATRHLVHCRRSGTDTTVFLHDDQAFDSRYVEITSQGGQISGRVLLGRRRAGVARRRSQAAAVTAFAFGCSRPLALRLAEDYAAFSSSAFPRTSR